MKIVEIMSKCSPTGAGTVFSGGWNWFYPAIGKVAGTAGNLERWVTGYKRTWESIYDSHDTETTWEWSDTCSKAEAFDWYDKQ
jgi:hypothetical protein